MINLNTVYEKDIPPEIREALKVCSAYADASGIRLFLVGGAVRDLLLEKEVFDTDIVLEGNAIEFARHLTEHCANICTLKGTHDNFKTAKVQFHIKNQTIEFDIASTRKEIYEQPAALPTLIETGCCIKEDVSRRDFTINSMALNLNSKDFCKLVDPLGGYSDIVNKKIRVLHDNSFIDDPTRILRALKFSERFGFELDSHTRSLQDQCLQSGKFDGLRGERIKSEIKQTFNLNLAECFDKFIKQGIYRLIENIPETEKMAVEGSVCQKKTEEYAHQVQQDRIWLIYLGAFLAQVTAEESHQICRDLILTAQETQIVTHTHTLYHKYKQLIHTDDRYEVFKYFRKAPVESIIAAAAAQKEMSTHSDLYLKELINVRPQTTGSDLIKMGLTPSAEFSRVLEAVTAELVRGKTLTKQQEIDFIKKMLNIS